MAIKVSPEVIQRLLAQGMDANLLQAISGNADPETMEAIRRFYPGGGPNQPSDVFEQASNRRNVDELSRRGGNAAAMSGRGPSAPPPSSGSMPSPSGPAPSPSPSGPSPSPMPMPSGGSGGGAIGAGQPAPPGIAEAAQRRAAVQGGITSGATLGGMGGGPGGTLTGLVGGGLGGLIGANTPPVSQDYQPTPFRSGPDDASSIDNIMRLLMGLGGLDAFRADLQGQQQNRDRPRRTARRMNKRREAPTASSGAGGRLSGS